MKGFTGVSPLEGAGDVVIIYMGPYLVYGIEGVQQGHGLDCRKLAFG